MKKVLVIGPNFFHYTQSIQTAFENLGWEAHYLCYDTPIHPYTTFMKGKYKLSLNKSKLSSQQNALFSQQAKEYFVQLQPQLVFIVNGEVLQAADLEYFRSQAKVALWMFDTLARYPQVEPHINRVHAFFCYEQADVEHFAQNHKQAYFLPQACDPKRYYTLADNENKDIDILFVGTLYRYPKRIALLRTVVSQFPQYKIRVVGVYKPYYKNFFKYLFREKRSVFLNHNLPADAVNQLYNRAKIVLNIHHETQEKGANPKVYEICASGAYQLCDSNPYLQQLFPQQEVGLYTNTSSLLTQIKEALHKLPTEQARKAQAIVLAQHTYTHRMQTVLDTLAAQGITFTPTAK